MCISNDMSILDRWFSCSVMGNSSVKYSGDLHLDSLEIYTLELLPSTFYSVCKMVIYNEMWTMRKYERFIVAYLYLSISVPICLSVQLAVKCSMLTWPKLGRFRAAKAMDIVYSLYPVALCDMPLLRPPPRLLTSLSKIEQDHLYANFI